MSYVIFIQTIFPVGFVVFLIVETLNSIIFILLLFFSNVGFFVEVVKSLVLMLLMIK